MYYCYKFQAPLEPRAPPRGPIEEQRITGGAMAKNAGGGTCNCKKQRVARWKSALGDDAIIPNCWKDEDVTRRATVMTSLRDGPVQGALAVQHQVSGAAGSKGLCSAVLMLDTQPQCARSCHAARC